MPVLPVLQVKRVPIQAAAAASRSCEGVATLEVRIPHPGVQMALNARTLEANETAARPDRKDSRPVVAPFSVGSREVLLRNVHLGEPYCDTIGEVTIERNATGANSSRVQLRESH